MMPKKILIADDDSLVRNVLRSFLESQTRFKVCGEAVNGLDAIEKARTLNPDLIVMDLSMPVMNGIEAGSVLKAMLPQVPIVIYTAHDSSMIEPDALAVGVGAVIQKHDMAGLVGHLRQILYSQPGRRNINGRVPHPLRRKGWMR
jgi:DNA-binding NarL/FixJ family response regulator